MDERRSLVAIFQVDPVALARLLPQICPTAKDAVPKADQNALVIEIVECDSASTFAVLISPAYGLDRPVRLSCCLAYCNDVWQCERLKNIGIPVIEAELHLDLGRLRVVANHYPAAGAALTWDTLMTIDGVSFAPSSAKPEEPFEDFTYQQLQPRPDPLRPGFDIVGRPIPWAFRRRWDRDAPKALCVAFAPAKFPDFNALFADPTGGLLRIPDRSYASEIAPAPARDPGGGAGPAAQPAKRAAPPVHLRPPETVGDPGYHFEDMELVGFRINVPKRLGAETDGALQSLVAPLNFHLSSQYPMPQPGVTDFTDFEYRVATRSIVVELIRYGRMKYAGVRGPLGANAFMSQHELLVRLLVGRVDEDSREARDPATLVQSIFVDNPTSKAVGLDMQGYPKQLASFCRESGPGVLQALRMDGTSDGHLIPLTDVCSVCMTNRLPEPDLAANRRLDFEYSRSAFENAEFSTLDEGFLSLLSRAAIAPWRQDDFDNPVFRRSFARRVVSEGMQRSRSVQVIPVTTVGNELQTWLTGTFELTDVKYQMPPGTATLSFYPDNNPSPWNSLYQFLQRLPGNQLTPTGEPLTVSIAAGDWYRVRCNMDLSINDGLSWE